MQQSEVFEFPDDLAELVRFLKELRDRADSAEKMFITALVQLEHTDRWQVHAGGDGTFIHFLKRWNICDASRYDVGKKALTRVEEETTETVGFEAIKVVVRGLPEHSEAQRVAIERLKNSAATMGGKVPERTAESIVKAVRAEYQVAPRKPVVSIVDQLRSQLAEAEEEIRALKQQLRDKDRALKAKDAELAELREKVGDSLDAGGARGKAKGGRSGRRKAA